MKINFMAAVKSVMASRTPAIDAEIAALADVPIETQEAEMRRFSANLGVVLKRWDAFVPVFMARGLGGFEIKREMKNLKKMRDSLDQALRILDPKAPAHLKATCQEVFTVLVAVAKVRSGGWYDTLARVDLDAVDDIASFLPVSVGNDGATSATA